MTTTHLAAAIAGLLASGGVAADAPVVSPQKTAKVRTAPVTIPGTGVHKGDRLPRGARLVYRDVALDGGQTVTLTVKAPTGKRLRGLAPAGRRVGFNVVRPRAYAGRRLVRVKAYTAPGTTGRASGRLYALTR
jgi:hypothetical protein